MGNERCDLLCVDPMWAEEISGRRFYAGAAGEAAVVTRVPGGHCVGDGCAQEE